MSRPVCAALFLCAFYLSSPHVAAQQREKSFHFAESDTLLLFTPFEDHSGFGGKWPLAYDVPRYLSSYCKQRFQTGIVGPIAVAYFDTSHTISSVERNSARVLRLYSEKFRVRYIVRASIETFSITRFLVAEQTLAGYEAFAAEITLKVRLYDAASLEDQSENAMPLYEGEVSGIVKDKGLGLTLLGKQTDRTNQYFLLDELYFGGAQFNKTIMGEAMLKCAEELSVKLEKAVPLLKTRTSILPSTLQIDTVGADTTVRLTRTVVRGEIILVDGNEVFLNIGSEEHVQIGDVLPVLIESGTIRDPKTGEVLGTNEEHVGDVQIIEIRAAHLSLATILKGKGVIKPRQKVRAVMVR